MNNLIRTHDQRLLALRKANDIRTSRAIIKRGLRDGLVTTSELLVHPPEYLQTMRIESLLRATPKIGPITTVKIMRQIQISPSKTVAGVSPRQREALLFALRGR